MAEHDALKERISGHWTLDDERWDGHRREHQLLDRATDVAATTLDKRIEGLNEFRAQLSDQAKNFVTRDLHDKLETDLFRSIDVLRERVVVIEKGDSKQEGRGLGQTATIAAIIAIISLIGVVVSLVLSLWRLLAPPA